MTKTSRKTSDHLTMRNITIKVDMTTEDGRTVSHGFAGAAAVEDLNGWMASRKAEEDLQAGERAAKAQAEQAASGSTIPRGPGGPMKGKS